MTKFKMWVAYMHGRTFQVSPWARTWRKILSPHLGKGECHLFRLLPSQNIKRTNFYNLFILIST